MIFDWEYAWTVKTVKITEGNTIGIQDKPEDKRSRFRISENNNKWWLKPLEHMTWEPNNGFELDDNGVKVQERFSGKFTIEGEGAHIVKLASSETDPKQIIINVAPVEGGGIGRGTGGAGRG